MNHETLLAQGPVDVNVSRCTVRVKTTAWADKRGLHTKKPDVLAPPVRRIQHPSRRRRRDRVRKRFYRAS